MSYEVLKNIITNRRSVRKFKDIPVPKEVVQEIIDCARWAPSDTNSQPWKFIVINNREVISEIEKATYRGMEKIKIKADKTERPDIARKIDVFGRYALVFSKAPSLILCLSEPYKSRFTEEVFGPLEYGKELWKEEGLKSSALATQNIMLAAHALGYGTCAMSGPMILAEDEIRKTLNIEEKYTISLMIALGVPESESWAPSRKNLDEIIEFIE